MGQCYFIALFVLNILIIGEVFGRPVDIRHETVLLGAHPPERTEVLINNAMVAGGMLYRFFRTVYRLGTIMASYMPRPPIPSPF